MAWIETESLSFVARHEAEDSDSAQRTLDALEDLRLRLEERFDEAPGGITVIVHPSPGWLAAAHPFLPAARLAAAPAGRRYLAGWAMASELHILNDDYTDRRAAGEDSLAALRGTAERLYAQILGGTVFDLLERERGPDACSILVSRLRREGAERAIELAFDDRFRNVEPEWRRYLREDVPRSGALDELEDEAPF